MIFGGFSVRGIHVMRDLGFCISSRSLSAPAKKLIRKTLPFMHGSYDFSMIYGKVFYEDRELSYSFDLIADDPRDLERQITKLTEFVVSVHDDDISDDDLPYCHLRGSFASCEVERDDYGLSAAVTVVFAVYPYLISDDPCEIRVEVGENVITNNGGATKITVVPDGTMTIAIGALRQTFNGETVADIELKQGDNVVTVTNGGGLIRWYEERL